MDKCLYCEVAVGPHKLTCPTLAADAVLAMKEWNLGWQKGFADKTMHPRNYQYYSQRFLQGFLAGKEKIEEAMETAWEIQCNGYEY